MPTPRRRDQTLRKYFCHGLSEEMMNQLTIESKKRGASNSAIIEDIISSWLKSLPQS